MQDYTWSNWAGTYDCAPTEIISARTIDEVAEVLSRATHRGSTVRPVGSGHSFTPLVPTDGTVLSISELDDVHSVDTDNNVVRVGAGATIGSIGEVLWDQGVALRNQGAIDLQTLAGAMGTSTHGSGLRYQALSGSMVGAELVTTDGRILELSAGDSRLSGLRASMGTLGVITRLDLSVQPVYKLRETITYWPLAKVLERWEHECHNRRHFSFLWGPNYEMSADLPAAPEGLVDQCLVRIYDEVDAHTPDSDVPGARVGRPYRIYPDLYPTPWEEVEYFIPFEATLEVLEAVRPIVERYPDDNPVECRTVAADDSWLSPMYRRTATAMGFCRTMGLDNRAFFSEIDELMAQFGGRPHWGKQPYFLSRDKVRALYPEFDRFVDLRRQMDPQGTLLNDPLRILLA